MYAFGKRKKYRYARERNFRDNWVAPRLNKRIRILEPMQIEEENGGLQQVYRPLKTVWGSCRPLSPNAYIRYSSVEVFENTSHEFEFRRSAVDNLGKQLSKAFDYSFTIMAPLTFFTQNIFLLMEQGAAYKGRIFRVRKSMDVDEKREVLRVLAEETEEHGTGLSTYGDGGLGFGFPYVLPMIFTE